MLTAPLVADVLGGTAGTGLFGTIYNDQDSNGVKTPGEDGLSGWTVYLDLDNSGTLNNDAAGMPEPSSVTNGDGDYVINHLLPGTYRVSEVIQAGWAPTAPAFRDVLVQNDQETRVDFFNFSGGDIVGTVWNDLNGDGLRATDSGTGEFSDPGLAGWVIFLDLNDNRAADSGEPTTTTDALGHYSFVNLPEGDYEVTEVLPEGWEVSPTYDIRQTAGVVAQQQFVQDFANFSLVNGSIQGTVWNDLNADGVREINPDTGEFLEPGLAGWTVFLDLNNDRIPQIDEPSTVTDTAGHYVFASLAVGDYEVTEVLPDGWYVSPTYDTRQTASVEVGGLPATVEFANFTVLNGSIRGTVWNDLHRDGIRNVDLTGAFTDPVLPGWQVFLDLNRNSVADAGEPATLTDAEGLYVFTNLQVGDYEVQQILPSGWEATTGYDVNQTVTVFSGTESIAADFANFNLSTAIPGSISGVIWNDLNGNGVRDLSAEPGTFVDPGLAGWTIFIDLNANGTFDDLEPNSTSAADGSYLISGVVPGSVTIIEVVQAGWRATSPIGGVRSLALKNGQNASGLDFGNYALQEGVIQGTVFADSNQDGLRNVDELGISDIVVYLDTNNNNSLDADETRTTTSSDLFYTPTSDEAGTYRFTHLAAGTYTVRTIVPDKLSATPSEELLHTITLTTAETRSGVDTAAVFRRNEIHGVKFHDRDGDHLRDPDEPGVGGVEIFIDLDRDTVHDPEEPSTVTGDDGSYAFVNLTPGSYVIREVLEAGYETTYPTTTGGILWPNGISQPAVGNVTPLNLVTSLTQGESYHETVSITLPEAGALTNLVDVFLLFDDTGSFVYNSPIVRAAFPDIIAQLQAALPGIDLGFGVGRFEEYGNFAYEYSTGRPFILNQPIVSSSTAGYLAAIQAALDRTTPGYGGDGPETDIEALYQLVTGAGFDGNNNGSVLDSGLAGLASTQLSPGGSGDVPSFASFQADLANSILPAEGFIGGGGFRPGALPIILTATDIGFAYQPRGETTITGVGGVTLPVSALSETSRPTTPFDAGAGLQQTITALNALGALVIGLGTNPESTVDPRQGLEALSTLTGAVNRSTSTIANGTADPIAPGDPLYFQIASGFSGSVATGVVNAIQSAATNVAVDITVQASDPRVKIVNHSGVRTAIGSGQTATFEVEFIGDGVPRRFDLQFVRSGTNVVLGSIPVVIGTPIPGDGYEFTELEAGEIETDDDFGSRLISTTNVVPVAQAASVSTDEDVALNGNLIATDDDLDTLQYYLGTTTPAHGQVVVNLDGSFIYTPSANYHGTDSFSFYANDGVGNSNQAVITITVNSVNDAPTATSSSFTIFEDDQLSDNLLATDIDGDDLVFGIGSVQPQHGTVEIDPDGTFVYTPHANYFGTDTFSFKVNDGTVDSAEATITITITPENDAPTANAAAVNTDEDTVLNGTLTGSDVEDDDLTFSAGGTQPQHGNVVINPDGTFTYTPAANYHGTDTFSFKVNDGTVDSAEATVTITITPENDAPTANAAAVNTDEDTVLNGTLTGTDVDGDSLLFAAGSVTPQHGTVVINPDGSFTYTPGANYFGTDSFSFTVNDGAVTSGEATVTITINSVNDAPVVVDGSSDVDEDDVLQGSVSSLGSDAEGNMLTYSVVTQPEHGVLSLNPDGTFSYTPDANFSGMDSFTFRVNDGSAFSNTATFTIMVNAVDDPLILSLTSPASQIPRNNKPVLIDGAASVTDLDTTVNYANARIRVAILSGNTPADNSKGWVTLGILNQGTGAGNVKIKGSKIYFNGDNRTVIATFSGGKNGQPLVINFTAAATEAAVNAVLKQVSIAASKKASTGTRTIGYEVTAGSQVATGTQQSIVL